MKRAIKDYELSLVRDKKNPKRMYAYVNGKSRLKEGLVALRSKSGNVETDPVAIADVLNRHFASVFVEEGASNVIGTSPSTLNLLLGPLSTIRIDIERVNDKLANLDRHKAMGADNVSPYVLRECASSLSLPLTMIFRKTFDDGKLPRVWKMANVTPLLKKGSQLEPGNYRPISLTSVPCKVLESIIKDEIMSHLLINNLIRTEQHGFVPRKSCETNLLETVDFATKHMSEKCPVDIVFLDFAKAFDKVPHKRLLAKLESLGIDGQLLCWLREFLSERQQRVVLGEPVSEWESVRSGVPQGSVLGPILFIIFINDLPARLLNDCKLFADDCKIMSGIRSCEDQARLQSDINSVNDWCSDWLMELNIFKCRVMHLGRNNPGYEYAIWCNASQKLCPLEVTTRERDLGVIITPDMKWHEQTCAVASKANQVLGILRNAFTSRDPALWKRLYTIYVRPHLEFAVAAWNPQSKGCIGRLERVQRRATRIPSGSKSFVNSQRCTRLRLTSLEKRRMRGDIITMFKLKSDVD